VRQELQFQAVSKMTLFYPEYAREAAWEDGRHNRRNRHKENNGSRADPDARLPPTGMIFE
jgi:hypothetical protein